MLRTMCVCTTIGTQVSLSTAAIMRYKLNLTNVRDKNKYQVITHKRKQCFL
jgi:hypothetical protein